MLLELGNPLMHISLFSLRFRLVDTRHSVTHREVTQCQYACVSYLTRVMLTPRREYIAIWLYIIAKIIA